MVIVTILIISVLGFRRQNVTSKDGPIAERVNVNLTLEAPTMH